MKLKLSHTEFDALLRLFNNHVMPMQTASLREKLLSCLLNQVHNKMYSKGIKPKGYSLTLTDAEAIAFYAFWGNFQFPPQMPYEQNLIRIIINQIHQKYA